MTDEEKRTMGRKAEQERAKRRSRKINQLGKEQQQTV